MSYKDNCKKENTPWIPPTSQGFTNTVKGVCPVPAEGGEDSRGAGNT